MALSVPWPKASPAELIHAIAPDRPLDDAQMVQWRRLVTLEMALRGAREPAAFDAED